MAAVLFTFPAIPKAAVSAQTATDYANAAMQTGSISTLVSADTIRGDSSQFAIYTGSQALLTFPSSLVISNGLASGLSGPSLYAEEGNPDSNPTGPTTSLSAGTSVANGGAPQGENAYDVATLEMVLTVPTNESMLSFSWSFCTNEVQSNTENYDYFTAVIQNEGFGQNIALLPNGNYVTSVSAAPYSNNPDESTPVPNNVQFDACTTVQTTQVDVSSLVGQNLVIDFTVADTQDDVVNSAVILSNVGFGIAPPAAYVPPPSMVNANVTIFAPYSNPMILLQASVAINGKQFSSTIYEGAIPQYGGRPNGTYGYLGNYQSFFGAISGCQQGHNIHVTVMYNGVTQTQIATCPALSKTTTLNFTMTG